MLLYTRRKNSSDSPSAFCTHSAVCSLYFVSGLQSAFWSRALSWWWLTLSCKDRAGSHDESRDFAYKTLWSVILYFNVFGLRSPGALWRKRAKYLQTHIQVVLIAANSFRFRFLVCILYPVCSLQSIFCIRSAVCCLDFVLTGIRGTNTVYFWLHLFAKHT